MRMKRVYIITVLTAIAVIAAVTGIYRMVSGDEEEKKIRVGFIYVGDSSTTYTGNFIKAQTEIENQYGEQVETLAKYNVPEGTEEEALKELVQAKCDLIFATSYAYGEKTKEFAVQYPDIQFCMATGTNANEEPVLENYHTFMGAIYEGRYISGVAAGMKLQELLEEGVITKEQARVGYVGAFPYAEVISGYTAFLLGVRSVVPDARMTVKYTNSWGDYLLEKKYAKELIEEGCVIISQHSDTAGPAVACEETDAGQPVYLVAYNQSMAQVAPTTYLTGAKINWEPYMVKAVKAVLEGKKIEDCTGGTVNENDVGAGFKEGWVQMLELNEIVAADGTAEKIAELIEQFQKGEVHVFEGDYIGVNPEDPSDTCDLREEYEENRYSSAPTFHYVLQDIITIEE